MAFCRKGKGQQAERIFPHKKAQGPLLPWPMALSSHEESGKVLAAMSQGIGDSPVPSCRVACAVPAKGAKSRKGEQGTGKGEDVASSTASSIIFIACFCGACCFFRKLQQLESCDETRSASLDLVLQLITSYNFLDLSYGCKFQGEVKTNPNIMNKEEHQFLAQVIIYKILS